jgi:hypothetical protein
MVRNLSRCTKTLAFARVTRVINAGVTITCVAQNLSRCAKTLAFARVTMVINARGTSRVTDKLTAESPEATARMVTLAGIAAVTGRVAVPAGACARTAAPFNNCNKRESGGAV